MSRSTVCLCMIVKNESHIIEETLNSVYKYIDYYVINDTGSTDNTKELIKKFFDSKNIKGEIIDHEFRSCKCHGKKFKKYKWFHFGWNRSYAIDKCVGKADYVLVMDADDLIIGDLGTRDKLLTADVYNFRLNHGSVYYRPQLFKNDPKFGWKYTGGIHEYLHSSKQKSISVNLEGDYSFQARTMGARSHDPNKYKNDAEFLEYLLKEEPKNERYVFYCAQSKCDSGDHNAAIKYYSMRAKMGGFAEEVYYSYYKIGLCKKFLKRPIDEIVQAFIKCHKYRPTRVEPLYEIIYLYRCSDMFKEAFSYAEEALKIKYPSEDTLFIMKDIYDYKLKDEIALSAYYCNKFKYAKDLFNDILTEKLYPECEHNRLQMNFDFSKLYSKTKPIVCIYIGKQEIECISEHTDLLNNMSNTHEIHIFEEKYCDKSCVSKNIVIADATQLDKFCRENEVDALISYNTLDYFMSYDCKVKKTYLWTNSVLIGADSELLESKFLLKHLLNGSLDGIIVGSMWHKKMTSELYNIDLSKFYISEKAKIFDITSNKFILPYDCKSSLDYSKIKDNFDRYIRSTSENAQLYLYDFPTGIIEESDYVHKISKHQRSKLYDAEYCINPIVINNCPNYPIHLTNFISQKTMCISSHLSKNIEKNIIDKDIWICHPIDSEQYWTQLKDKLAEINMNPSIKQNIIAKSDFDQQYDTLVDII